MVWGPKRDWVWFLLFRLCNHILIKETPLKKNLEKKKKLLSFLWEHTVFAPSDVKSRAGSITHSPYSIRPLTPRCWFFTNVATDLLSRLPKLFSGLFLPLLQSSSWLWCLCSMALLNFFNSVYSELNFLFRINHSISDTRQLLKWMAPNCKPNNPGVSYSFGWMDSFIILCQWRAIPSLPPSHCWQLCFRTSSDKMSPDLGLTVSVWLLL